MASTLTKYPKATLITIYSLGVLLGCLHLFFGVSSITPMINANYYNAMRLHYNSFSKSLTFLHEFIDMVSLSFYLRHFMSSLNISFGALLIENGHFGSYGKIGNYGLILVDLVYLFLQLNVGTPYERVAPTIVFTVLLITRLLIVEQSAKKAKVGVKTRNAGKPKTSTPKKNRNE